MAKSKKSGKGFIPYTKGGKKDTAEERMDKKMGKKDSPSEERSEKKKGK